MSENPSKLTGHRSSAATPVEGEAVVAAPRWPRAPLVSVLGVFALFGLFVALVWYLYLPRRTGAFPDDGIRTADQRLKTLAELRAKEAQQLKSYAWVDQKAGVVQLPLDRAVQLTLEKYQKQPSK
jgi:hypothetical protein